jgi:hypothetical protein
VSPHAGCVGGFTGYFSFAVTFKRLFVADYASLVFAKLPEFQPDAKHLPVSITIGLSRSASKGLQAYGKRRR